MKKRILSLVMALVLAVGLLPVGAMAGDANEITVNVSIADMSNEDFPGFQLAKNETTAMIQIPVTLPAGSTAIDALKKVHELYHSEGADAYTESGNYFSKFWGTETYNIGYFQNGQMVMSPTALTGGEDIEGFIYNDYTKDIYARFNKQSITVEENQDFDLTLCGATINDLMYQGSPSAPSTPVADTTIVIGDSSSSYIPYDDSMNLSTDENGTVSLHFDTEGTYTVSATNATNTLLPAICTVTVLSEEDYENYLSELEKEKNGQRIAAAKEKLTWDLIKGLNTSPSSVTSPLSLPSQITLTDNLGTVSIVWSSSTPNVIANDGTITRPTERTEVTLTATLTAGTETDTVLFPVTVIPPNTAAADSSKMSALMDGIASGYTDTYNNSKVIIDMAAYEDLKPDTAHKTTADAKQKYVNFVTSAVTDSSAGDTTCALSIISLQGLGYDPQQLYPVNSNTALSIVTKLNGVAHAESAWSAPYTLAAYNQGGYGTDSYEQALITKILANQENDGSWTEWGDSIQTTANMIVGLSFYRDQDLVQTAIDNAVTYLSTQQKSNGTFDAYGYGPDADACANVVMALATVGINPDTDQHFIKNGNSALDGLLLFALEDNSGFGYQDNTVLSAYATEEGFRALIAAAQVMSTGEPYNIYDFSANPVTPARETGNSSSDKPTTPPTNPDDGITVTVTIKADTGYWLRSKSVTVSEGSTVCDAFVTALEGTGITQVGAETGYIHSITKNGVTLAEFTQGPNSGWLYKVNGELPTVGVTSYSVHQGDSIVLYYTEDWTKDPSAGSGGGVIPPEPETPASTLTPEASANSKGEATVKVDADAVKDSLAQAEKDKADALIIAPKVTGQADTVTTQLPLSAAETISQDSDLDLTVQTDDAAVTIPNEALSSIVSQSSGSQTIEIVVKTCDPDTLKDQAAGLNLENAAAVEVTIRSGGSPITTFGGQTLAIDLPVDKTVYTEGAQYKVLVLSADGTVEALTGQCIREQGRLVVRVSTPHLSTFLVTTQTVLPFTDVDGHWALDAIRFVYDQGLMTGTKETQFSPNKTLNRAMLATILYRMEGSPAVTGENPYTDVAAGTWYTDAVLWASEQGIVNGYGNGAFGPLNNITREQLAAMLLRYSDCKKYDTAARNDLTSYADADDISAWALEALRWANAQGLVNGRTETTLVPQGDTTRAETATVLMRYLDTIAG